MIRLFRRTAATPARAETRLDAAQSAQDVVEVLTSAARDLANADGACVIQRHDDQCNYLTEDAIAPLWAGQRFPLAMCVTGMAMLERKTIVIPDILEDRRIPLNAYIGTFVRSMVAIPVGRDDPQFAIGAYWREARPIPAEAIARLTQVADRAADAFARMGVIESLLDRRAA